MSTADNDTVRLSMQAAANALRDAVHTYSMTPTAELPPAPDLYEQVGDFVDTMREASALLDHLTRAAKSYKAGDLRSDNDDNTGIHLMHARIAMEDAGGQIGALLEDLDTAHNALSHLGLPYDPAEDPDVPTDAEPAMGPDPDDSSPAVWWWVSWYSDSAFTYEGPWWVSGYDSEDRSTVVAAVVAESEAGARGRIRAAHDDLTVALDWRFLHQRGAGDSPFSDRFTRADWMRWPDVPAAGTEDDRG